jgi:pimeloyl-ACP methyl ester carboxylesterase
MGSKLTTLVFQPPDVTYLQAKRHLVWLRTVRNTTIPAIFIDRGSKITILFSHGNAEDLGLIYEWMCELSNELKINVLAYDYEGYGKAGGTPSERGCCDAIDASFQFLTETMRIPSEQVVLFGRSIGTGPSCYLAERLHTAHINLGGLILQVNRIPLTIYVNYGFVHLWCVFIPLLFRPPCFLFSELLSTFAIQCRMICFLMSTASKTLVVLCWCCTAPWTKWSLSGTAKSSSLIFL